MPQVHPVCDREEDWGAWRPEPAPAPSPRPVPMATPPPLIEVRSRSPSREYIPPLQQMSHMRSGRGFRYWVSEGGLAGLSPFSPGTSFFGREGYLEALGAGHRATYMEQLVAFIRRRRQIALEAEASTEEVSGDELLSEPEEQCVQAPGDLCVLRTPFLIPDASLGLADQEEIARQQALRATPQLGPLDVHQARGSPPLAVSPPELEDPLLPGPPYSLTRGVRPMLVTDVGLNTDTLVEEHGQRLRNAAIGHFLECKFITSSVVETAIRETGYTRTVAIRLNLLRSYLVGLRAFESLGSEELQMLREMFPPRGVVAPGLDGGARRYLSEQEVQDFLLSLQEELEQRGEAEAAELRQRMIQTKARPKSPSRRRIIGPARMPPPEPIAPPKRRPMGPPGRLLDPASGVIATGEIP